MTENVHSVGLENARRGLVYTARHHLKNQAVAMSFASEWHKNQFDKAGVPYVQHLVAVRDLAVRIDPLLSTAGRCAALLHDVLEDTDATHISMREAGIMRRTIELVDRLTLNRYGACNKMSGVTYLDRIRSIALSGDVDAMVIKLADNLHNSDLGRLAGMSSAICEAASERIRVRYKPARAILLQGLREASPGFVVSRFTL